MSLAKASVIRQLAVRASLRFGSTVIGRMGEGEKGRGGEREAVSGINPALRRCAPSVSIK